MLHFFIFFFPGKGSFMNLHLTTGDDANAHKGGLTTEKRFDTSKGLADLKERLFLLTGIAVEDQALTLFESNDEHASCLGPLTDAGMGNVAPNMRIHIKDLSGKARALENDLASVPKYVMPDEVYDAREGTYRAYKKSIAQFAPPAPAEKTCADFPHIVLGERCLVESGHRGEVAFVGNIDGKTGLFVGVRLDDPFGLNDGSVNGKKLFEALPKCGVFLRPEKIQVGDFPAEDEEEF
jgi:tubulin-folding cofactor B